jgi:hypothetical protein
MAQDLAAEEPIAAEQSLGLIDDDVRPSAPIEQTIDILSTHLGTIANAKTIQERLASADACKPLFVDARLSLQHLEGVLNHPDEYPVTVGNASLRDLRARFDTAYARAINPNTELSEVAELYAELNSLKSAIDEIEMADVLPESKMPSRQSKQNNQPRKNTHDGGRRGHANTTDNEMAPSSRRSPSSSVINETFNSESSGDEMAPSNSRSNNQNTGNGRNAASSSSRSSSNRHNGSDDEHVSYRQHTGSHERTSRFNPFNEEMERDLRNGHVERRSREHNEREYDRNYDRRDDRNERPNTRSSRRGSR